MEMVPENLEPKERMQRWRWGWGLEQLSEQSPRDKPSRETQESGWPRAGEGRNCAGAGCRVRRSGPMGGGRRGRDFRVGHTGQKGGMQDAGHRRDVAVRRSRGAAGDAAASPALT